MPDYIHVKDKRTGHEYVVPARRFDPEKHTKTGKPARDNHGDLVPMKPHTSVDAEAKKSSAKKAAKESGAEPANSGQQAETDKE